MDVRPIRHQVEDGILANQTTIELVPKGTDNEKKDRTSSTTLLNQNSKEI